MSTAMVDPAVNALVMALAFVAVAVVWLLIKGDD